MHVVDAKFISGPPGVAALPESNLPEIAFAGRSNAGKSSLLNRVCGRKNLARTSATPGRTQALNLFEVQLALGERRLRINLVDLPGFGFAKVSKGARAGLERMCVEYVERREQLRVVCLLQDSKREPEEEELALRDIVFATGKHCIIALTKVDRLNQKERRENARRIAAAYGLQTEDLLLTGKDYSAADFWGRVGVLLE